MANDSFAEGLANFLAVTAMNNPDDQAHFQYYRKLDAEAGRDANLDEVPYAALIANKNRVAMHVPRPDEPGGGVEPSTLGQSSPAALGGQRRWLREKCPEDHAQALALQAGDATTTMDDRYTEITTSLDVMRFMWAFVNDTDSMIPGPVPTLREFMTLVRRVALHRNGSGKADWIWDTRAWSRGFCLAMSDTQSPSFEGVNILAMRNRFAYLDEQYGISHIDWTKAACPSL